MSQGWAFLVARGRRRGYSVLLAPGFLHESYGLLEEVAGPVSAAEPVRVAAVRDDLTVVWTEHKVTAGDLADGTEPRDEHSRPLRLLYGFACQGKVLTRPDGADLARSLATALDTYRRFLAGEQRFTVEPSNPFELRTTVSAPTPTRPRRRYLIPLTLIAVALGIAVWVTVASVAGGGAPETPPETTTTTTTTTPVQPDRPH